MEIRQIAPQGAQHSWVHHLHQAVQVLQPVLQRGAREHEGVAGGDQLDEGGDLGAPVLDALGLIQYHKIRAEGLVDHRQVAQDQLVIDDHEPLGTPVLNQPRLRFSLHHLSLVFAELFDLSRPLLFQGGGADHQDARRLCVPVQPGRRGDGLQGLAQPHVVSQQGAAVGGQEGHPLHLVGIEPRPDTGELTAELNDVFPDLFCLRPVHRRRGQTQGVSSCIFSQVDVRPVNHRV